MCFYAQTNKQTISIYIRYIAFSVIGVVIMGVAMLYCNGAFFGAVGFIGKKKYKNRATIAHCGAVLLLMLAFSSPFLSHRLINFAVLLGLALSLEVYLC